MEVLIKHEDDICALQSLICKHTSIMRHTDMEFARRSDKRKPYTLYIMLFLLGQLHSHIDAGSLGFTEYFGTATLTFSPALKDMQLIQRPTHQD